MAKGTIGGQTVMSTKVNGRTTRWMGGGCTSGVMEGGMMVDF